MVMLDRKTQLYWVQREVEKCPDAYNIRAGFFHRWTEPMDKSIPQAQGSTDKQLIEYISQIQYIALGKGAATCHVCGARILPGRTVAVYVYRPAGASQYRRGACYCATHNDEHTDFRRGRRELVVIGRVGTCTDQARQTSWPVLLAPELVAVNKKCSADANAPTPIPEDARETTTNESPSGRASPTDDHESYGMYYHHEPAGSNEVAGFDTQADQNTQDDTKTLAPSWTDNAWDPKK